MTKGQEQKVTFDRYQCGDLGRVIWLHGDYYMRHWGFDLSFEAQEARELAEFLERFNEASDLFLAAREEQKLVGVIAIDGGAPEADWARLRWFIVDERLQGSGLGRKLINQALDFSQRAGHKGLYLWTFAGLDAARTLYEGAGFTLAEVREVEQWGGVIREQKFELRFG